jgi:hypothetical protein
MNELIQTMIEQATNYAIKERVKGNPALAQWFTGNVSPLKVIEEQIGLLKNRNPANAEKLIVFRDRAIDDAREKLGLGNTSANGASNELAIAA